VRYLNVRAYNMHVTPSPAGDGGNEPETRLGIKPSERGNVILNLQAGGGQAQQQEGKKIDTYEKIISSMAVRPYQLLCVLYSLGREAEPNDLTVKKILELVRENPDLPITLRCNAGDVFAFQDPGQKDNTPGSEEFNRRRDMEILWRLDIPPGAMLPFRIIFNRILNRIETVMGICGFKEITSEAWRGCLYANKGYYEKARKIQLSLTVQNCGEREKSIAYERARKEGITAIIPPRSIDDMDKAKEKSLEDMYEAKRKGIRVRPHLLLCAVEQYGGGIRPPYPYDNLPELIQLILKEPDILITLVEGADWMICAPCPGYEPRFSNCIHVYGSGGLMNQVRDLRVLQKLGLTYDATLKARDLLKIIFQRIPSTADICYFPKGSPYPSVWWDPCAERADNAPNYERGRLELAKLLGIEIAES
jgi:hypothetical protein